MAAHKNSAAQFILDDHKRLIGLFRQYEAAPDRAPEMLSGIIQELLMEVEIHSSVEEQIFYPSLLSHFSSRNEVSSAGLVDQGIGEHGRIDQQVSHIRSMSPNTWGGEEFRAEMAELIRDVESHFEWEELELLKHSDELSPVELSEVAGRMSQVRNDLLRQPQYRDAQPQIVQNPRGGEQMRVTRTY